MKLGIRARLLIVALVAIALLGSVPEQTSSRTQAELRLGMIGLDTSHVLRFIELLNDPSRPDHVPGARVVAAFKGGSPDMEQSASRIERFTAEIRDKWKVELVGSIEDLCRKVDATHPDLFWYGIHSVEALYTLMGPGCESVARTHTSGADVVTGKWKDGRIGVMRGIRDGDRSYGAVVRA